MVPSSLNSDYDIETDALALAKEGDQHRLVVGGETYEGLSETEVRGILGDHPAALREWSFWHRRAPQTPARRSFLRWIEDAEAQMPPPERREALATGVQRRWGELLITVRVEHSRRVYELRHVEDEDRPPAQLDLYDDPLEARTLAKYDDNGRYRPLSTAPTLQTGWLFSGLDATAAVRTVDFFYPATIANWHREREGELDVTHWTEATERQTGIYDITEELRGDAVDWVAEACCADSQCLKRRQWDERADRSLSVPRGDGVFPCREPCSLVVAAARKWALLEQEEEQTYSVRLTSSEREQVRALLDAAADGTVGEVREADVRNGANRYRARYLRAKRGADLFEASAEEGDQ